MIGNNHAPYIQCDYRNPAGNSPCRTRFGGDRIGESRSALKRRAKDAGWIRGDCEWWRRLHPGRAFEICPACATRPDVRHTDTIHKYRRQATPNPATPQPDNRMETAECPTRTTPQPMPLP